MVKSGDLQPSQEAASLVLRLAGPSTTKAGLSTEQTEINRVIADASKGSKFYENEKRKDKEVTARIERILKARDQAIKGVDMEAIERERDLTQYILHVDMDAFYANVELLDNPSLAGKPFGVGHGVLSTASYEARKYGVRSGMPGYIALKLCPNLIFVNLHMSRYSEVSKRIMAIFRQYDPNMFAAGVDEAYLKQVPCSPITEYCKQQNLDPDECVQQIRQRVFDETKLTVSAGIAANKVCICSDKNKPNGQFRLSHTSEAIKKFMHDLPIRKIPGVGRVHERLLDSIGVKTCGDIYKCRDVLSLLDKQFGLHSMLRVYLGIASNVVQPWEREEKKSIGSERTFRPISEKETILQKLEDIAAELEHDMERGGWSGRTVTLKYKLDTYEVFSRAKSFNRWIKTKSELYEAGKDLLQPEWPLRIRLIGLRVTKLKDLRKRDDGIAKACGAPLVSLSHNTADPLSNHSPKKGRTHDDSEGQYLDISDMECVESNLEEDLNGDAWDGENGLPKVEPHASTSSTLPTFESPTSGVRSPSRPTKPSEPRGTALTASAHWVTVSDWQDAISRQEGSSSRQETRDQRVMAYAQGSPKSTSTAIVSECPLCTRSFTDNDELNAHVDWCLSREAIRSAQAKSGKSERRKLESSTKDLQEWWKVGSAEGKVDNRKAKRRKLKR
ncbi:hypothetical protein B0F90DRAFT_1637231 [Multifurca ochricompacta]|uniref:DNA polymerase kappa n=1 Tax=Multifurca ochricompacta TaxID=376703 RepID=A0AAD4LZ31_9AGAM|nr:hypothetical protein B0F90DRAFT_1637231 [Multifurca ochricompacta]